MALRSLSVGERKELLRLPAALRGMTPDTQEEVMQKAIKLLKKHGGAVIDHALNTGRTGPGAPPERLFLNRLLEAVQGEREVTKRIWAAIRSVSTLGVKGSMEKKTRESDAARHDAFEEEKRIAPESREAERRKQSVKRLIRGAPAAPPKQKPSKRQKRESAPEETPADPTMKPPASTPFGLTIR